jgi:two-component system, sensor histidine kinase and response regulator
MRHTLNLPFAVVTMLAFTLVPIIQGYSQPRCVLQDSTLIHRLDAFVDVFVDPTDTVSIEQIRSPDFQKRFHPSNDLTFGYTKANIWIKVVTRALRPQTQWYLEIPAPYLEYVDFYQQYDSTWQHHAAGYYRPQNVRVVSHTGHVLPLHFNADSTSTVYVKIGGRSPKSFPLYAMEKEVFIQKVRREDVGYGIFFGILIVMFFYNLLLYVTLKQINYLLYICTIVCTFLIFAGASGYGGKFLWPENPHLNFYVGRMTLGVLAIFLSVFTIRFLEVRQYSKTMYYILLSLIPLALVASVLVATQTMSSAGNNLISLSTVVYMTTGIVCRIKGNKTATYFIAAWTIYFFGGLLLTLRNSGVFEFNFWTTHFVEIGAAMETMIIAFALGDRYRRYKQEKEEAQALALKLQQEATEILEEKVKERTAQLSNAYEELHSTLETNKQQTKIIENKNAELDAFFYRISHDLKGPISSLLGLAFLAKREVKDEQALEYINRQHHQVERLSNIITGLINLTKLSHEDLQREKIDFDKMIDGCIASFNGLDNFENMTFRKEIQPGIEFYSEWTLLNAILQNLIENAIKYSGNNSPYVSICVRYEYDWLMIEVEDNGQGIPREHQHKIFEMFYRATQSANGTGLGLYIMKRSVDRLKGTIDIKSEVGIGSTFTVKLPSIRV